MLFNFKNQPFHEQSEFYFLFGNILFVPIVSNREDNFVLSLLITQLSVESTSYNRVILLRRPNLGVILKHTFGASQVFGAVAGELKERAN